MADADPGCSEPGTGEFGSGELAVGEFAVGEFGGGSSVTSPARIAVAFARLLRGAGVAVPVSAVLEYAGALAAVGLERRGPVYWAGRATLIRRPEDTGAYDRAFSTLWLGQGPGPAQVVRDEVVVQVMDADDEGSDDGSALPHDPETEDTPTVTIRYSRQEVLHEKDFAQCSAQELEEAHRIMSSLRVEGSRTRSRRWERSGRNGSRPDVRRTIRLAARTTGEIVRRQHLEHASRPRRVVLLCDVSGSMATYSRVLLRFLHVAVVGRARVEAFALGTRLTRLTRQLGSHDPDMAMAMAAEAVADWSGGTRLGEGLRAFNDRFGVRGLARGAVVVILSDGWDRGDPELLAMEMARLRRVAHHVVWVNPLKASPGYAPLARGMAAALPYVDHFVAGHSLASLEELAELIGQAPS
jgi:uncharacterized protein with von Willebrand factor type A (vWA) domain